MATSSKTQNSRPSHPPLWLVEGLDIVQRKRWVIAAVALGVVALGALASVVLPDTIPPTAGVGAAVGVAALLLGLASAVASDATELIVRGPRHVAAAGGELVAVLPRDPSVAAAGPLAGAIEEVREPGAPLLLAFATAGRDARRTVAWTDAIARALVNRELGVLRVDLASGRSDEPGLLEVVRDGMRLADVVEFEPGVKLARLRAGTDHQEALGSLTELPARLPRDLDILLVSLPTAASRSVVAAAAALDHVLVLAERDRTSRVDLIASLDALETAGTDAQVVLLDTETALRLAPPVQVDPSAEPATRSIASTVGTAPVVLPGSDGEPLEVSDEPLEVDVEGEAEEIVAEDRDEGYVAGDPAEGGPAAEGDERGVGDDDEEVGAVAERSEGEPSQGEPSQAERSEGGDPVEGDTEVEVQGDGGELPGVRAAPFALGGIGGVGGIVAAQGGALEAERTADAPQEGEAQDRSQEPEVEPDVALESDPEAEPVVEPEVEREVEPQVESDPELGAVPEAAPDIEPDVALDGDPEAEPEAASDLEPAVTLEVDTRAEPEVAPEVADTDPAAHHDAVEPAEPQDPSDEGAARRDVDLLEAAAAATALTITEAERTPLDERFDDLPEPAEDPLDPVEELPQPNEEPLVEPAVDLVEPEDDIEGEPAVGADAAPAAVVPEPDAPAEPDTPPPPDAQEGPEDPVEFDAAAQHDTDRIPRVHGHGTRRIDREDPGEEDLLRTTAQLAILSQDIDLRDQPPGAGHASQPAAPRVDAEARTAAIRARDIVRDAAAEVEAAGDAYDDERQ